MFRLVADRFSISKIRYFLSNFIDAIINCLFYLLTVLFALLRSKKHTQSDTSSNASQ